MALTVGQSFGGGFCGGQISTTGDGVATHYLIVAPKSTEVNNAFRTGASATDPGNVIDGLTNSNTMNDATHPAAQYCRSLTTGGFTDWYLPAKNELEVLYYNLKPGVASNNTSSGINANSVPKHLSNYTTTTPSQTLAGINFRNGESEAFTTGSYWCSSQFSDINANKQDFYDGAVDSTAKTNTNITRAVRRITIDSVNATPNIKFNVNGVLKPYASGWVKIDGALRNIDSIWVKVDGVLKKI